MEEEGAKILGVSLSLNKSLKKLEVGWNHIRLNGAALLCKGLSVVLFEYRLRKVYYYFVFFFTS